MHKLAVAFRHRLRIWFLYRYAGITCPTVPSGPQADGTEVGTLALATYDARQDVQAVMCCGPLFALCVLLLAQSALGDVARTVACSSDSSAGFGTRELAAATTTVASQCRESG